MKRNTVLTLLLVVVSIGFSYLMVEAGVRTWMWYKYAQGNYKMVATWSQDSAPRGDRAELPHVGWGKKNTTLFYWQFDESSRIVWSTQYHINNVGLPSWKDYAPRGAGKEYRVAVVGDSFTAGLQMATPWPDKLEDMLNADQELKTLAGCDSFKVYNFGLPAGGFPEFAALAKSAKILDPDMVILNYIEADFPRCNSCGQSADNALKEKERKLVDGDLRIPTSQDPADDVFLHMACEQEPIGFANDTCRHSFALNMPPHVAQQPDLVRTAKKTIVQGYLRGQLWTSRYPYALRLLTGRPVSLQDFREATQGNAPEPRKLTDPEMIAQAAGAVSQIQKLYPELLITLNPTFDDLSWNPSEQLTARLADQNPAMKIELMRRRLPQGLGKDELIKWYCLPHDGHMSEAGGIVYAQAMQQLIKERLQAKARQ